MYTTIPCTANNAIDKAMMHGWTVTQIEEDPMIDLTVDPNYIPYETWARAISQKLSTR